MPYCSADHGRLHPLIVRRRGNFAGLVSGNKISPFLCHPADIHFIQQGFTAAAGLTDRTQGCALDTGMKLLQDGFDQGIRFLPLRQSFFVFQGFGHGGVLS